ncbi:MAG TPA: hypothetical protein VNV25_16110 [Gemmatimonadaceae bacterium]|jgi:hypothetical protein|nr:hypothetical protein [Gemmatimonadaceae bacterium]
MRLGTVLLSATLLACTSGTTTPHESSGPRGMYGEVYGTRVSADSGAIGDSVAVTLTITNSTSSTMQLIYGAPFTYARFMQNDTTFTTVSPLLAPDTIVLAANADTTLTPIWVHLSTQPLHPLPTAEVIGVPAGTYDLAACAFVPQGANFVPSCGPTVQFTVTP